MSGEPGGRRRVNPITCAKRVAHLPNRGRLTMGRYGLPGLCLFVVGGMLLADGPRDNVPDNVRPVPPPGIKIGDAARADLTKGVAALRKEIAAMWAAAEEKPALRGPDARRARSSRTPSITR